MDTHWHRLYSVLNLDNLEHHKRSFFVASDESEKRSSEGRWNVKLGPYPMDICPRHPPGIFLTIVSNIRRGLD